MVRLEEANPNVVNNYVRKFQFQMVRLEEIFEIYNKELELNFNSKWHD